MPRLKVLKDDYFTLEGWQAGTIIELDDNAARVPLKEGIVEVAEEAPAKKEAKKPAPKKAAAKKPTTKKEAKK